MLKTQQNRYFLLIIRLPRLLFIPMVHARMDGWMEFIFFFFRSLSWILNEGKAVGRKKRKSLLMVLGSKKITQRLIWRKEIFMHKKFFKMKSSHSCTKNKKQFSFHFMRIYGSITIHYVMWLKLVLLLQVSNENK